MPRSGRALTRPRTTGGSRLEKPAVENSQAPPIIPAMKARFCVFSLVAVLLALYPLQRATSQTAKQPSPVLVKIAAELHKMIDDHPKLVATGVATDILPEKLSRLSNRADYLSGKITKQKFLQRSDEITATWQEIFAYQQKQGHYDSNEFLRVAEAALIDHSLP
jgi:hypothetical protein